MNSRPFLILFLVLNPCACSTNDSNEVNDVASISHADLLYRRGPPPDLYSFSNDVRPNEWGNITNWKTNTPGRLLGHAATHLMIAGSDGKVAENMVLYGGFVSCRTKERENRSTWIYTAATNSWRSIWENKKKLPHATSGHTMVTLCRSTVFLFGGATCEDVTPLFFNDTWSFSNKNESWHHLELETVDIAPRSYHAAVPVYQRESNCNCRESMLVFGGSKIFDVSQAYFENQTLFNDLWELRCESNRYRWIRLDSEIETWRDKPSSRFKPASASFHDTMYVFGGCTFGLADKLEICIPKKDMWTYSTGNKMWKRLDDADWSPVDGMLQAALVNRTSYLTFENVTGILLCCKKPFRFYDIYQSKWHTLDTLDSDEKYQNLLDPSIAVVDSNVLIYGGGKNPSWISQNNLWNITMLAANACLLHEKPQSPPSPPLRGDHVAVVDRESSMIIVHGGLQPETMFYGKGWGERNSDIWVLDMHSLSWSVRKPKINLELLSHAGVLLFHPSKVLVVFGGVKIVDDYPKTENSTWGYYPRENVWREFEGLQPEIRRSALAVAISNRTMLMMGGISPSNKILEDMWTFELDKSGKAGIWTKHKQSAPVKLGQSIVLVNQSVFLYGGAEVINQTIQNHSEALWKFDIDLQLWQPIDYTGNSPGPRCLHSATGSGEKLVVAGGCRWDSTAPFTNLFLYDVEIQYCERIEDVVRVWYFSIVHRHWTEMVPISRENVYIQGNLLMWGDDYLLALGGYYVNYKEYDYTLVESGFMVTMVGCPAGTDGDNFWFDSCKQCPIDQFSSFGSSCQSCPDGWVTSKPGATSKENCSVCKSNDYCGQGVCYAPEELIAKNTFQRRCRCNPGFSRDARGKCVIPTAFLATFFSVGVTVVIAYVIFVTIRNVKRNRTSYKKQENQLKELTQVWAISPKDVTLKERIDGDSPGGFGEVYKAEYREITVAVKRLQSFESSNNRSSQEFDREIEIMKTLRHPNIVMFFGGGRFEDSTSFLVLEYMPRGSLGTLLRNKSFQLANPQKRSFALNAAEGMAFLHGLEPPRVHRDLKSFNLLVSDRWVVKVADFGTARLAQQEGINQRVNNRNELPSSLHAPLLEADSLMSTNCGTPLWSAPEILRRQNYGTPVDVYR